jgi:hypothetical protein
MKEIPGLFSLIRCGICLGVHFPSTGNGDGMDCKNYLRVKIGLAFLFLFVSHLLFPVHPSGEVSLYQLENQSLSLELTKPSEFIIKNKYSNKEYLIEAEPFGFLIEKDGSRFNLDKANFLLERIDRPEPKKLFIEFAGKGVWKGVRTVVAFELPEEAWYVRKRVHVTNESDNSVILLDAAIEKFKVDGISFPEKPGNPLFLDNQLFWGLEWPIAEASYSNGHFVLKHHPSVALHPGESWTSKTSGFGVSREGKIQEAFGHYIQDIRANRVDFTTLYFDWLCHDNSGPLESEILANFAVLKKMKALYGLQFDIYNSDAGLVESMGTYFPQYKPIFEKRFPRGLRTIADASKELGMRLGLWIGPDGFGETPQSMEARKRQLISWVKESNVGLFKLDTVVSALRHENKYILEKKYQALMDALSEIRQIDPRFVAINHRVNNSPYMLTITDCILWKGEETYNDVHITNRDAWLYNRVCASRRDLSTLFYNTPFRLFEDHGLCFNTNIEKWEDEFITQAFGRASVISPEMYGTFFFLRDKDYPKLARLIQFHKQSQDILKKIYHLEEGDIAHSNGKSSLIVLRNMTWERATKTIPLDKRIGLNISNGTSITIRQRHPFEYTYSGQGEDYRAGSVFSVILEPFEIKLIQIDAEHPKESMIAGIPYEIIPYPDHENYDVELLGEPGKEYELTLYNFEGKDLRWVDKSPVFPTEKERKRLRIRFPGDPIKRNYFAPLGEFAKLPCEAVAGEYLAELAKFTIDDNALEIREMEHLKKNPSRFPEVEACRSYMWDKVIQTHTYDRNAFDGDHSTRWSDGYPMRSPFTGTPRPYRSDTSLWRIDMGDHVDLRKLELLIVRRTEDAHINSVELSSDLRNWVKIEDIETSGLHEIPFFQELRRRRGNIRIYDVQASDERPVRIAVEFPENRSRYIRIHGRNFSVSEIFGYDGKGKKISRQKWHATNFYGLTTEPKRILKLNHSLTDHWPGQEFAVAVYAGDKKFHPVDDVYVAVLVGGEIVIPRHRAPSYPYHNYEWNSWWLKEQGLSGMTFRVPSRPGWTGKDIEFFILLFSENTTNVKAKLFLVTPEKPFQKRTLTVRTN